MILCRRMGNSKAVYFQSNEATSTPTPKDTCKPACLQSIHINITHAYVASNLSDSLRLSMASYDLLTEQVIK